MSIEGRKSIGPASFLDDILGVLQPPEVPGELVGIDINQVHLVDWPANGDTQVFIKKRDNTMADETVPNGAPAAEGAAPAAAPPADGGATPPPAPEGMMLSPGVKGAMMGIFQSAANAFGELMTKVNSASDGEITDNTIPKELFEAVEGLCESTLQGLKMYKTKGRRLAPWMPHFKAFGDLIGEALHQLESANAASMEPAAAPAPQEAAAAPTVETVAVSKAVRDLRSLIEGQEAKYEAARLQDQAVIKGLQQQVETMRGLVPPSGVLPRGVQPPAAEQPRELSNKHITHLNINDLRKQQDRERAKTSTPAAKAL